MKILIVCNNAFIKGNGLCTAIQELCSRLAAAGQEVRVISVGNSCNEGTQAYYPLKHFKFPFFEPIIYANGFCYAAIDRTLLREAISWADVVHLEEAVFLQVAAARIAKRMGKPCVATFHLFAENIMANLGMGLNSPLNPLVTWLWRKLVYDKCTDIHCPSATVRRHLERSGFKARLHEFSNGLELDTADDRSTPQTPPYLILCTGRLSNEKSQMTLLDAMRYSHHSKDIKLVFAGRGPKEKKYRKAAERLIKDGVLKYEPSFGFYTKDELLNIARQSYLYIHCAWVEVEGLSCLEALGVGLVPIVAEGPFVATSQFALDNRSRFPARNSRALAERIDWWIEHPEERMKMSPEYAESAQKYSADESTKKMIAMYELAIR